MRSGSLKRFAPAQTGADALDWDAVYAEQLPRVLNFFRYHTGDEALAKDLTATTFEKAWRNRERYRRDVAGFSTWLFSIARNVAADHFRRHHEHVPWMRSAGKPPMPLWKRRSSAGRTWRR